MKGNVKIVQQTCVGLIRVCRRAGRERSVTLWDSPGDSESAPAQGRTSAGWSKATHPHSTFSTPCKSQMVQKEEPMSWRPVFVLRKGWAGGS